MEPGPCVSVILISSNNGEHGGITRCNIVPAMSNLSLPIEADHKNIEKFKNRERYQIKDLIILHFPQKLQKKLDQMIAFRILSSRYGN